MPERKPTVLLDGLLFAEGPRWHEGRLWFSDMHAHEVVAVDLQGNRETIVAVPNWPSGLGFLPDGRLLVVSMTDLKLMRLDPDGLALHADLSALATGHCNDMVTDAQGRSYVGNFGFDMLGGADQRDADLILVTPDGPSSGMARVAASGLAFPNGAVITPDGRTLIVAETYAKRLSAFDVAADGSLSNRRLWANVDGLPDGICLDAEGCVWFAVPRPPGRFVRVAEGGEVKEQIFADDRNGFACMLGGPDRRTLFLLEAFSGRLHQIKGPGNARIRAVQVEVEGVGWP